jgi:hypothetical protein
MLYRRLNLIDGPDTDLHTLFELLREAYTAKAAVALRTINIDMLSKVISAGFMEACVVEAEGVAVGLQTWEHAPVWYDTRIYHVSRLQYIKPEFSTPTEEVLFTQWGAAEIQKAHPEDVYMFVVMPEDKQSSIVPQCGFPMFAETYKASL